MPCAVPLSSLFCTSWVWELMSAQGRSYCPVPPSLGAAEERGRKARGEKGEELRLGLFSLPSHPCHGCWRQGLPHLLDFSSCGVLWDLRASHYLQPSENRGHCSTAAASKVAKVERLPPTGSRREGASARGSKRPGDARSFRAHVRRRPLPSRGGFPALLVGGRTGEKRLEETERRP